MIQDSSYHEQNIQVDIQDRSDASSPVLSRNELLRIPAIAINAPLSEEGVVEPPLTALSGNVLFLAIEP